MDGTGVSFLSEAALNIEQMVLWAFLWFLSYFTRITSWNACQGLGSWNKWAQQAWWSLWHFRVSPAIYLQTVVDMKVFQTCVGCQIFYFFKEAEKSRFNMNYLDSILKTMQTKKMVLQARLCSWPPAYDMKLVGWE